jgi:hypothetical protein
MHHIMQCFKCEYYVSMHYAVYNHVFGAKREEVVVVVVVVVVIDFRKLRNAS